MFKESFPLRAYSVKTLEIVGGALLSGWEWAWALTYSQKPWLGFWFDDLANSVKIAKLNTRQFRLMHVHLLRKEFRSPNS